MARRPSADSILRNTKKAERRVETHADIATDMILPNVSSVEDFSRKQALFWSQLESQTGLTGDKTGTFNLTTTGEGGFGGLMPYDSATFDLGSVGLKWRNLIMSGDITTTGDVTATNLKIDHIAEKTSGHNVVVDDSLKLGNKLLIFDSAFTGEIGTELRTVNDASASGTFPSFSWVLADDTLEFQEDVDAGTLWFAPQDGITGLGKSGQPWKELYLSGDANIGGDLDCTNARINGFMNMGDGAGGYNASNNSFVGGDVSTAGATANNGSMVFGKVNFGDLAALGGGSAVLGRAQGADIRATGEGSFATGYANGSDIIASGDNSAQFGIGTNSTANSAQFGTKLKITHNGAFCISLTNKTGSNTVQGQLVKPDTAVNDAFITIAANDQEIIGIVLEGGVADGSEAWVVISGIADVLMDAGGSARGDRIISSATAGSGDVWNVGGAVNTHFQEIGHCIETRIGAGLARCVLHFN